MVNCCENMFNKIEGLCEQLENLKLNLSDCVDLGPLESTESSQTCPVDNKQTSGHLDQCGIAIGQMIVNLNQFANDIREMKATQTATMLIVSQLLERMNKLELHCNVEPKVTVKKAQKRRQSKSSKEQEECQEKENIQKSIRTEVSR